MLLSDDSDDLADDALPCGGVIVGTLEKKPGGKSLDVAANCCCKQEQQKSKNMCLFSFTLAN